MNKIYGFYQQDTIVEYFKRMKDTVKTRKEGTEYSDKIEDTADYLRKLENAVEYKQN